MNLKPLISKYDKIFVAGHKGMVGKAIVKKLLDSNVETRPFLTGDFSLQPVNKKFPHIRFNSLQNVELCHRNAFALPCHQDISMQDVDKVCSIIADFFTEPK